MPYRIAIALVICACASLARADTLVLANGDTINGEIVEWEVTSVVLEHPQLGRIRLALDQLDIDIGKPPNPGLFGTDFLRGWTRSLDIGANGKDGNTVNQNLTVGLDLAYEDDFKRWAVTGRYFFASEDNATTDNNGRFDLRRDWLLPESEWFWRAATRYQFDKFESWQNRLVLFGGPGYHLIEHENYNLDGMMGLAFTREAGDRDVNKGEAVLAFDYSWTVSEELSLRLTNQAFTELVPEAGELRNVTHGEARWKLTEEPALSLKLGFENEYETDIEPGDERNDFYYYLSLGLGF
ncbi:MAG: DUF481 domain-containing protein [Myxococcota bacterium]